MADKFKGLDKETLASALEIKNSMKDIGMATQDLNKRLQRTNSILVDVGSEFNKISKAANNVADLQEKAKRSSTATKDAFTEQIKQLNIVKTLNIQIDNLYRASKTTSGETKANLELQTKNLSAARDNAQALANDFKSIAESSAELSNSTLIFSTLAEVASSAKGLKTFAAPFEAAAEASRKQVLENAKSLSCKSAKILYLSNRKKLVLS
jgi:methyl-accepting chemotaxis protein